MAGSKNHIGDPHSLHYNPIYKFKASRPIVVSAYRYIDYSNIIRQEFWTMNKEGLGTKNVRFNVNKTTFLCSKTKYS